MKEFETQAAVSEMLRLARELVPMLLEGGDARLRILRLQWGGANVSISNASSWGFYADISVPAGTPRVEAPSQCGGNAVIPVSGCAQPAGCVLYIVDGALHFLEVYSVVSWEQAPVFGFPGWVEPFAFRASAVGTTRA